MAGVRIVATGGTIANTLEGRVGINSVLEDIRADHPAVDLDALAAINVVEALREGAETFTPREWVTIANAVAKAADDPLVDGVVVSHGTYTAEETAFFLSLAVRTEKPVVVVCSQRKHRTIGNDGDKNLVDAIRLAATPDLARMGVVMLLNEEIHAARDVTKTNQRPDGFKSNSYGLLGSVEADRVTLYRTPTRRHTSTSEFQVDASTVLPRVDIVSTYAGADDVAVDAFVAAGAKGIVVSGFAYSGRPHLLQRPGLERAVEQGVAVVLTNRAADGRIPSDAPSPFIQGDSLTPQKAQVLLSLALTVTDTPDEIQRIFDEY